MTPSALAAAALRVLEDPSWAAKLSQGGRSLYERHLSWDAIADRLLPRNAGFPNTVEAAIP
jgi:glycosyltransferase involved in cell wall biosynthesis